MACDQPPRFGIASKNTFNSPYMVPTGEFMSSEIVVQLHRFGIGGGEGIVDALERTGIEIHTDKAIEHRHHVVLFRDPFEANLRLLLQDWSNLGPGTPLARTDSVVVAETMVDKVLPNAVSVKVVPLLEALGVDLQAPQLVELRQMGAQVVEGPAGRVLLVRADAALEAISAGLSELVEMRTEPLEFIDEELKGPNKRHLRAVPREQLKARYITSCITQRWVQAVFTDARGERIRKRWERVDLPAYTTSWSDETFGREVETPPRRNDRKVFAAEGGFEHFSSNRTNIAISKFWHAEISDPDDAWNGADYSALSAQNRDRLGVGDVEGVEDLGNFSPKKNVLIHDIRVSVRDMPLDKYRFFLGDNCIYVEESEIALEALGSEPVLPHAGEIHCTAISMWENASYDRSIGLPEGCPLLLTNREQIRIPTCFSRHRPHSLDAEDFSDGRVRIEIEYSDLEPQYKAHKFLRIPYLDQYPDADKLILPDRPWYQPWDRREPLDVKGFAVYFSPKAAIAQEIEGLAIYAVGEDGNEVPGKRLELPNQTLGGGSESVSVTPAFVEGHIRIEPGEFLSASGLLASGTPSADCAIFVLVEIPSDRVAGSMTNPLFKSNGVANLDYVQNGYNADRIISRPTPAGVGALEAVAIAEQEPWVSRLGLDELPTDDEQRLDEILAEASTMIFVD